MRKCEDMLDEDGFWKVDHSSLSLEDRQRYCKKYTVSGGRRVEDCKRKNEDRTTWRGKVEVKFFMNNLSLVGSDFHLVRNLYSKICICFHRLMIWGLDIGHLESVPMMKSPVSM